MCNRNISDEEKASLKLDLAEISAERDSLTIINEKLQKQMKVLIYEAELGDAKHKNLKSKCKTLLNKHRGQSDQKKRLTNKLGAAKNVLINVDQLCRMHEKNYGLLMNYFGKCCNFLKKMLDSKNILKKVLFFLGFKLETIVSSALIHSTLLSS